MTPDDPIARFAGEYERAGGRHDRWLYERDGDAWRVVRLYP